MPLVWTELTPATTPDGDDNGYALAYDQAHDRIIMFSGFIGSGSDTWEFTGGDWNLLAPSGTGSLTDRLLAGMAWDGTGLLMYGGFGPFGGSVLRDAWRFTGSGDGTWTQLSSSAPPGYRQGHTMVWDGTRVVVFGGQDDSFTALDDTWVWNGSSWTQLSPATSPDARLFHMMEYDPDSGRIILFGGTDGGSTYFNDTWALEGDEWTELAPDDSPAARNLAAMAYNGTVIHLFGGSGGSGFTTDNWAWRNDNWNECTPDDSPSSRNKARLVYNPDASNALLFGGDPGVGVLDDTWISEGSCVGTNIVAGIKASFGLGTT